MGTWAKGILRFIGTCLGAFSAWLALSFFGTNPYGLVIWLAITCTIATYLGLPKGLNSRMGLDPDMAWGSAYFCMTNVLVALEVYWGYGGKNDITVNRIVSNATGIAMAMFMAIFPMLPGIYGGSPHAAMFILDDSKKIFQDCME